MTRLIEIAVLLAVCGAVFFAPLSRHDYIKTEALRAVVVAEMLERPGTTMPTVHQTPYLKKPPLYAWTATTLARTAGRFDERIARLPSAVCGALYVLLLYVLAERWIGRGAGVAASVFALLDPTVADYAVRAELDLPFGFFCTANVALTFWAMRTSGPGSALAWLGAYALALAAGMWKGPHSLIFMWLTMIGYAKLGGGWRFLKAPAQWIGLALTVGALAVWAIALSGFAGSGSVGRTAGIELFVRLIPHKIEHLVSILTFVPQLIVITLPASAFALLSFSPSVRTACGLIESEIGGSERLLDRCKTHARTWVRALAGEPRGLMILAWLLPSLLFMAIAPGKAPRYSIPLFAPVFLLAAYLCVTLDGLDRNSGIGRHVTRIWRGVFVVFAIVGVLAFVRFVAGLFGVNLGVGSCDNWTPWVILGLGWLLPLVCDATRRGGRSLRVRLITLLVVVLTFQPVLHGVWWPRRVAADSQRAVCERIDAVVPAGQDVCVLGKHEYPDTQMYSGRTFRFVRSIDEALSLARAGRGYCIVRLKEVEDLAAGAATEYRVLFEFERADKKNLLIDVFAETQTD